MLERHPWPLSRVKILRPQMLLLPIVPPELKAILRTQVVPGIAVVTSRLVIILAILQMQAGMVTPLGDKEVFPRVVMEVRLMILIRQVMEQPMGVEEGTIDDPLGADNHPLKMWPE